MQTFKSFSKLALALTLAVTLPSCADKEAGLSDGGGDGTSGDSYLPSYDVLAGNYPKIEGRVIAPRGSLPVAGALVYAVSPAKGIAPIPDTVYCDKCVELAKDTPHAFSAADGTFAIRLPAPGKYQLVTQKGAFRRIRQIDVPQEGMALAKELTTLPHLTDRDAGDTIPKMLVIQGAYDAVQTSLAKMGLFETDGDPTTYSFDFIKCDINWADIFNPVCTPNKPQDILTNYDLLSQYQIVFLPCDSSWLDGVFTDPTHQQTIVRWIKEGGRLYATDYQYDVIQQTVPNYIHWVGESNLPGTAELGYEYDASAIVNDDGLKDWLHFQGIDNFSLIANWTIIDRLEKLPTPDPDQQSTYELEPKAWMSGNVPSYGIRPMTVSFPYGCGRLLFSTYHTEGGSGAALLPQERALLYIILETAVCLEPPKIE